MKVSELSGALLDYWVARAEGKPTEIIDGTCFVFRDDRNWLSPIETHEPDDGRIYEPSGSFSGGWIDGGPIIEREKIELVLAGNEWGVPKWSYDEVDGYLAKGATPLIAAMRAYVASKYGDTVPDEAAGDAKVISRSHDPSSYHLFITAPHCCEGKITLDRIAGDGAFKDSRIGDFVWIEGRYGDITIPKLRCEVVEADSLSITVKVPPFDPRVTAA